MNIKKLKRLSFTSILIISVILSIVLGTTAALANNIISDTLDVGSNYISGFQDDGYWSYNSSNYQYMYSGKSRVDVNYTRYWNGYGNGYGPTFGTYYIFDQKSYDYQIFWEFIDIYVNGCDIIRTCSWTMDQLSSSNKWVFCQQHIQYGGVVSSDYILTDTTN